MLNVKDFGAVGDGVTKDTAAVQRAVNAGGMVNFPPGTYLCGTIYLKSHGGIHLESGAVLLASPDREDYNADDFCPQNRVFVSEHVTGAHFIVAAEQTDITICGEGCIDGNRQSFYGAKEPPCRDEENSKFSLDDIIQNKNWRPGQMIFLCESEDIQIRDVKLNNAPYWTLFLHGCRNVQIRGLNILNDQRTRNGDGIDIDCCQNVTVSDCLIESGDDCITLRGYDAPLKTKQSCENITVTNCVLHTNCNALRIGVGNGIVRNAVFSNLVIHRSNNGICIVSNYSDDPERGVQIESVSFENIRMNCTCPFHILSYVTGCKEVPPKKKIRDLVFRNIHSTFCRSSLICGSAETGISDISFDDVQLVCTGEWKKKNPDMTASFGEWCVSEPEGVLFVQHTESAEFSRVKIVMPQGTYSWKYGLLVCRSGDVAVEKVNSVLPIQIVQK